MKIDEKSYFCMSEKEMTGTYNRLLPVMEKDPNINTTLLGLIKIMFEDQSITHYDWPVFLITDTAWDIVNKIKVSFQYINKVKFIDSVCHLQWKRGFIRFCITDKVLVVTKFYLYKIADGTDRIGYSAWYAHLEDGGFKSTEDHLHKEQLELYRLWCYINYSDEKFITVKPKQKIGTKKSGYKNNTGHNMTVVDSKWNTTSIRVGQVEVDGHLRLQPCGPGRSQIKLIWIKDHVRDGYIKRAKSKSH